MCEVAALAGLDECIARMTRQSDSGELQGGMGVLMLRLLMDKADEDVCDEVRAMDGLSVLARIFARGCERLEDEGDFMVVLALRALLVVISCGRCTGGRCVGAALAYEIGVSGVEYLKWAGARLKRPAVLEDACTEEDLVARVMEQNRACVREMATAGGVSACLDLMDEHPDERALLCTLVCIMYEKCANASAREKRPSELYVKAELRRGSPQRVVRCLLSVPRGSERAEKDVGKLYKGLNAVANCTRGLDALLATELWTRLAADARGEDVHSVEMRIAAITLAAKMLMRDPALAHTLCADRGAFAADLVALCEEHLDKTWLQLASLSIFQVLSDAPAQEEAWVTDGPVVRFVRTFVSREYVQDNELGIVFQLLTKLFQKHRRKWEVGRDGGVAQLLAALRPQQQQQQLRTLVMAMYALHELTRELRSNQARFLALGGVRTVADLCRAHMCDDENVRLMAMELLAVNMTIKEARHEFVREGGFALLAGAVRAVGVRMDKKKSGLLLLLERTVLAPGMFRHVPEMLGAGLLATLAHVCKGAGIQPELAFFLLQHMKRLCSHPASRTEAARLAVHDAALCVVRRFREYWQVVRAAIQLASSMYVVGGQRLTDSDKGMRAFAELALLPNMHASREELVAEALRFARIVATSEPPSARSTHLWREVLAKLAKIAQAHPARERLRYPVLALALDAARLHVGISARKDACAIVAAFEPGDEDVPIVRASCRLLVQLREWVDGCEALEQEQLRRADEVFHSLMCAEEAQSPARAKAGARARRRGRKKPFDGASASESETFSTECIVCCESKRSHAFVPCFHLCACAACAGVIMDHSGECPFCRKPATGLQKIFWV